MESLGHYLKVQRKLRGISLEDVSLATKVAPNWLEMLEANAFEKLPGEIFAKGYLRLYAESIGLEPDDVILRYEVIARKSEEEALAPRRWWRRRDFWRIAGLLAGTTAITYWVLSRFACAPQWTRQL